MPTSPVDLTTVAAVKSYLPQANSTADDAEIQVLITALSQEIADWTGRTALNNQSAFTETRSGNGDVRMYTKESPIVSIQSVQINGSAVPISGGYNQGGAAISENADAIVLVSTLQGKFTSPLTFPYGPLRFYEGNLNVLLQYTAGYTSTPADLNEAVAETVAQNYMRRQTIDQASKQINLAGGGSTTIRFQSWWTTPHCYRVFQKYRRIALVN